MSQVREPVSTRSRVHSSALPHVSPSFLPLWVIRTLLSSGSLHPARQRHLCNRRAEQADYAAFMQYLLACMHFFDLTCVRLTLVVTL
eukprot:6194216-Pleurochrysis_carterae.AAC.1